MTTSIESIATDLATNYASEDGVDVSEFSAESISADSLRGALVDGGHAGTDDECRQLRYAVGLQFRAMAEDRRSRIWIGDRMVAAVHAWFDDGEFSVSLVDSDGDEIKCIGGSAKADDAIDIAVQEAKRRSVQALFVSRAGEKSVRWQP